MSASSAAPVEVDVLPPDGRGRAPTGKEARDASDIARIIAYWMDEFIRIPGTKIRLGLDPLLSLLPVGGGLLSSGVSLIVLIEGLRLRVPLSVLARMGLNILINEALDSIPVAGDVASVFFRSNTRNFELLNQWRSGGHAAVKRSSRLIVAVFIVGLILLMATWVLLWVTMITFLWKMILGGGH